MHNRKHTRVSFLKCLKLKTYKKSNSRNFAMDFSNLTYLSSVGGTESLISFGIYFSVLKAIPLKSRSLQVASFADALDKEAMKTVKYRRK